jgi:hypothetical protein
MNWYSNDKISLILLRGIVAFVAAFVLLKALNSSPDVWVGVVAVPLLLTIFNLLSHFKNKQ